MIVAAIIIAIVLFFVVVCPMYGGYKGPKHHGFMIRNRRNTKTKRNWYMWRREWWNWYKNQWRTPS